MKKGELYNIHGYKHNGKLYKTWDEAILLDETDDYYVFGNNNTKVTKIFGKSWNTKETAILFYFKDNWYNVVAQLKKNGIYYYCNLASPVIIENKTIKFIDYDLDLRIFPDNTYKVLDRAEYEYHKRIMRYPKDLQKIINYKLKELIKRFNYREIPFDNDVIRKYEKEYNNYKK
ncbi:MAG: DUF402 domain-containing protein [Bacilli bacterium]|nr:DUF402 domain-containing protein [Bacilli bacterium]